MDKPNFEDMNNMSKYDWYVYLTENPPKGTPMAEQFEVVTEVYDDVDRPKHYMLFPDMEAIDVIEKALTQREFLGYLKGNILKYKLRAGKKNDAEEDLRKSESYQGELFAKYQEDQNE